MKKLILLVLVFIVSSFPLFADGVQPSGSGTQADPYQVATLDNLLWISTNDSSWDKDFTQTTNIDAADTQNWNSGTGFSPIGNSTTNFTGTYDGNNHIIQNLYINRPGSDYIGLFGYIYFSNIDNLGLTNAEIHGNSYVGTLAGFGHHGMISYCYTSANVTGTTDYAGIFIGKLIITSNVHDCFSEGSVSANQTVGGLVGSVEITTYVTNSYSQGSVTGNSVVGGLIGQTSTATITDCYSTGYVTGSDNVGGLIGNNAADPSTYTACFWDTETSGQSTSAGGTGKTTIGMKDYSSYIDNGWDFLEETANGTDDNWGINYLNANNGYPFLAWEGFNNFAQQPSGFGTEISPYLISNLSELAWISIIPSSWSAYFLQTDDIDAANTQNWNGGTGFNPIGENSNPLTGSYDGGGHVIQNLYINLPDDYYVGLFGCTFDSSTIENLGITDAEVHAENYVGCLVGILGNSTITDCYSSGTVNGNTNIGGLIGYSQVSIITDCYSIGTVNGNTSIGGLVGYCYNNSTLSNCFSTANVNGYNRIGGLVGGSQNSYTVNCYSSGAVSGYQQIGGLIGYSQNNDQLAYCYSTGSVDGYNAYGGLIGYIDSSTITASFWDVQTSGQSTSAGGIGKTTAEMKNYATFYETGWDFLDETNNGTDNVWGINFDDNSGYPFLAWEGYNNFYQQPSGSGTIGSPYLISNLNELAWLSTLPSIWSAYFLQTADIDATDTQNWNYGAGFSPIGDYNNPFTGYYDGGNYSIDNLFINRTGNWHIGLFGYTNNATVQNLNLTNTEIAGGNYTGSVVGFTQNTSIVNCCNNGNVNGGDFVGGMIGYAETASLSNCFNSSIVNGNNSIGGLIGNVHNSTTTNCYNTADVSGSGNIGGIFGRLENSTTTNCFSTGYVNGTSNIGGLIGDIISSTVTASFWNTETSGQSTSAAGTGKTTAEMRAYDTYFDFGWDFLDETTNGTADLWGINPAENNGYPFLSWQGYLNFPIDFPAGSGTEADPYQISSLSYLKWLSENQVLWNKHFIQTIDIDATDTQSWNSGAGFIPIGNNADKFSGSYDGDGYLIQNIYINRSGTSFIGLFGSTDNATLENINLSETNITGDWQVGGLAGDSQNTTIINCSSSGNIQGSHACGGLLGTSYLSTISNCYSDGSVQPNFANIVGGLIGNLGESSISNCYSKANVGINGYGIGGLSGKIESSTISDCYSTGLVAGSGDVGGLIGENYNSSSTITNSFWDTETSGQSNSAGGTGKTTNEMQDYYTFYNAGWDFMQETDNGADDDWGINSFENDGYPFLAWQGYLHILTPTGNGTEAEPYQINSLANLGWLSINQSVWDKYYIQTANVDAANTQHWNNGAGLSPIGDFSNRFTGSYDGNGHVIQNLYIDRDVSSYTGLFGFTDQAFIENLGLTNVDITGESYVGGIVGHLFTSTITDCSCTGYISAHSAAGMIVGASRQSYINNSYCSGSVTANFKTGGIAGQSYYSEITNSYSFASSEAGQRAGGLVGEMNESVVTNCYCTGTVQASSDIGGLIGLDNSSTITACFWDTETSGQSTSAGGTGKTTAEMKDYYTFYDAGWDFMDETTNGSDDYWGINPTENSGYPFLVWQGYTHNINLEAPSDVTISISGNEVTLNWTEVTGASSYLIFAADTPDGTFTDITAQGSFGTPRKEKNLNHRLKKAINNKRILTRSIQSWTITTSSTKKFYYVKASN